MRSLLRMKKVYDSQKARKCKKVCKIMSYYWKPEGLGRIEED